MPDRDMRPVSELIGELFRRKGMKRSMRRAEAVLLWPRVVGADVARFSTARTLANGVLVVDVSDSETAMHLSLQRRRFLAKLHDTYDAHDVKEIRFQVGRVASGGAASGGSRLGMSVGDAVDDPGGAANHAADPQAVAALARDLDDLDLSEEVGAAVLRAGRSLLGMRARQKAAGYRECPTCGALHDGLSLPLTPREEAMRARNAEHPELRDRELCLGCRRYAGEPRVTAEARRLALAPGASDPELSEAELAVAGRLAAAYLDSSLHELLPRAVSQPALKPQFELVARCRAALSCGKRLEELDDTDMLVLDERIVRFLGGAWSEG